MKFNLNTQVKFNNVKTLEGYALEQMMNQACYLTPDALMSYCSTRLRGIDDQVHKAFAQQQQTNADSSVLTQINISVPDHDLDLGDFNDRGAIEDAVTKLSAARDAIQDPTAKSALQAEIDQLNGDLTQSSGKVHVEDFKNATSGAVQKIQQDLNSGAELSMINLQSLMSQRQQAIQVCTNLVQSLGDQVNKIAENIGH